MNRAITRRSMSLPAILATIASACLSACTTTSLTPDGHEFTNWTSASAIRAELGKPDYQHESEIFDAFGRWRSTEYLYLERRYFVCLSNGTFNHVVPIPDDRMADATRMVNSFRREIPKIKVGDSAARVLGVFGPPDTISKVWQDNGVSYSSGPRAYSGQLERVPPDEENNAAWETRCVCVNFRRGVVHLVWVFPALSAGELEMKELGIAADDDGNEPRRDAATSN